MKVELVYSKSLLVELVFSPTSPREVFNVVSLKVIESINYSTIYDWLGTITVM